MFDDLLGETLTPARVDYLAAQHAWEAWFDAHPLPTNALLDARLRNAETRAGFVPVCRARGIFHLPTVEFTEALIALLRRLPGPYLEVGAGRGALARHLRAAGLPLRATDDGTWWPDGLPADVVPADIPTALADYAPATVLAIWPPRDTDWPALMRAAPSVRVYLIIGDGNGHMTGTPKSWTSTPGWRRTWCPALANRGRCRLDADGTSHTRALLVRRM